MSEEGTSRRSRRATSKVNYAREQEFSDEDLFGDEEEQQEVIRTPAVKRGRPKGGSSRKRQQLDQDDDGPSPYVDDGAEMYRPAKPVYTEKGYDPALPSIRERFPFLPEYELDGSPRIDLIVGRRPVDEKEINDVDPEDEEDNDEGSTTNVDEKENDNTMDMDKNKRLGGRGSVDDDTKSKRGQTLSSSPIKKRQSNGESDVIEYEYLVKYKNRSYLHLEWKTGADLESMSKSAKTIYRRYLKKIAQGTDEELEDPNFDPSFAEPQKILAEEEQELELELSDKELLRWEKEKQKEIDDEESSGDEGNKDDGKSGKHEKEAVASLVSKSADEEKKGKRLNNFSSEALFLWRILTFVLLLGSVQRTTQIGRTKTSTSAT
jgi:hypothetical protein